MSQRFSMDHWSASGVSILETKASGQLLYVSLLVQSYSSGSAIAGYANSQYPFDRPKVRDLEMAFQLFFECLHLVFGTRRSAEVIDMDGNKSRSAASVPEVYAVLHGYALESEGNHHGVEASIPRSASLL